MQKHTGSNTLRTRFGKFGSKRNIYRSINGNRHRFDIGKFELDFAVNSSDPSIYASVEHGKLKLSAEKDYDGTSEISLTVFDDCDKQTTLNFDVTFGAGTINEGECAEKIFLQTQNNPKMFLLQVPLTIGMFKVIL